MPPENNKFGGGISDTVLHPIVLVAMLVTVVLIFVLPRKYVVGPLLFCVFLTPLGQEVYLGGGHLSVSRILVMAGCLRLLITRLMQKNRLLAGGFNPADRAFSLCILCQAFGFVFHFLQSQAIINQIGFLLDFLAAYFLLRSLIQDEADMHRVIKCFAFIAAIVAVAMVIEQQKMINIFGLLGGVRSVPEIREGKIRSQGVFQHSILAGTFAATLVPLFFLLWKNGKAKLIAAIGMLGASIMTVTAWSSTPLLAYAAGLLGVSLWPIRTRMRLMRWGVVFALIGLQLVMKAPFWFLIAHIDLTGGSSGYHRAMLVDHFIRNFSDWWLPGVKDTSIWGDDMWDVQNQFVAVGVAGGLIALFAFIAVIYRSFGRLGEARKIVAGDKKQEWQLWLLGSALFANIVGFFGANYFDQSRVSWFVLLAVISAVTAPILQARQSAEDPAVALPFSFSQPVYSRPSAEGSKAPDSSYKSISRFELRTRDRRAMLVTSHAATVRQLSVKFLPGGKGEQ